MEDAEPPLTLFTPSCLTGVSLCAFCHQCHPQWQPHGHPVHHWRWDRQRGSSGVPRPPSPAVALVPALALSPALSCSGCRSRSAARGAQSRHRRSPKPPVHPSDRSEDEDFLKPSGSGLGGKSGASPTRHGHTHRPAPTTTAAPRRLCLGFSPGSGTACCQTGQAAGSGTHPPPPDPKSRTGPHWSSAPRGHELKPDPGVVTHQQIQLVPAAAFRSPRF